MALPPVPDTAWYVSTTTRSRPTASRNAISTGTSCIVEQLGLATMPSCHSRSSGFTWLTTSGTAGSMRQALELSMTVAPRRAASGASTRDVSPPAENSAISTPSKASGVASWTVWSVLPTSISRPALRALASSRRSPNGNSRSSSIRIIVPPTTPVAPTTATESGFVLTEGMAPQWS